MYLSLKLKQYSIFYIGDTSMHLFETEEGDIWVCITCGREREQEIRAKNWEYIFDKDDPVLRCKLCGKPDYEMED
jgi:hypothetical protein